MRRRRSHGAPWLHASLVLVACGLAAPAAAQLVTDPGTVVHTIDTSLRSPPAPDAAGISYRPDTGELLTCDSEVDETVLDVSY